MGNPPDRLPRQLPPPTDTDPQLTELLTYGDDLPLRREKRLLYLSFSYDPFALLTGLEAAIGTEPMHKGLQTVWATYHQDH